MKNNTFDIMKMFFMFVFVTFLIAIFIVLLVMSSDNKLIDSINEFTRSDTKVLYFSNNKNYSKYPIELFDKYDIEYLYINTDDLSKFEEKKIKQLIDNTNLHDIIIIFKEGKLIDSIVDYGNSESLNAFLQKYNIIPSIISDPSWIIEETKEALTSEFTLLYIPYKYDSSSLDQNEILYDISLEYNINYKLMPAYLLSYSQQEKLNSILQISSVNDQIVILVKEGKIIGSIRGINDKIDYLNKLYEYNFISEIENYIQEISYEEFEDMLNSNELNVVFIIKDDCKYCDITKSTLNKIIINYDIPMKYINIVDFDTDISNNVERKLTESGYSDGFTTPLTVIIQSNKVIDYIIGSSNDKYFVDIFTENGIIK